MMRLTSRPAIFPASFGGLALGVVKVRRNGDDRFGDFLAEVVFGGLLQLLQNQRRNLGRGVLLVLRDDGHVVALTDDFVGHHLHLFVDFFEAAPHEALDGENGVLWVGDGLALGDLADEALAGLREADH